MIAFDVGFIVQVLPGMRGRAQDLGQAGSRSRGPMRVQLAIEFIMDPKRTGRRRAALVPYHLASLRVTGDGRLIQELVAAATFSADMLMAEIDRRRGHELGVFAGAGSIDQQSNLPDAGAFWR